ncbi:MAG TPA: glycine/sarcosine/betaine reductase selenoprotein B family protein [Pyrinomonadaceae bacterium]|jgi:D-proline reductase (dithiol) PrdB|nr:glycine/sarcosine/betaine reductase selenoprotein B family protein [Pyrinomonadaceae bacterium]
MEIIEKKAEFVSRFSRWTENEDLVGYPFVQNIHSPFTPVKRALPMLNLALISSAGAYIDGTDAFDTESRDGDLNFREVPIEVESGDLLYAAKGYDPHAVKQDRNVQIPIERLLEYQANAVIGKLNEVWWSLSPWIPNAAKVADEIAPKLAERLHRYGTQAALLIPASRLCHQTLGVVARGLESAGIPTMMISVDARETDRIRPPRTAYYVGEFGSVAGKPNWREHQLRILDEALRWTETFDQPGSRKLAVSLETATEAARGER